MYTVYGIEHTQPILARQGFYTPEIEMRKSVG